jgi:hypothetical protein
MQDTFRITMRPDHNCGERVKSLVTIPRAYFAVVAALALACTDSAGPVVEPPTAIHLLSLETFDGSGQAVHPDAALTPAEWGASEIALFATPYPNGDATKENPSLYAGRSSLEWRVPPGVMNPIEQPAVGYLSDPDEVFNPETGELWLYYRAVTSNNDIYLARGGTPTSWSAPTLVAKGINHTIVSPTVVRRAQGDWLMWAVNSGTEGCTSSTTTVELRRSTDGITWADPITTDLAESQAFAWHIDVEWIPGKGEFWATYNVKVPGSCTTSALHFATSVDGLHWVVEPGPVLSRGVIPAFSDIVYRASLLYDEGTDMLTLWYSGASFDNNRYTWRIATETLTAADFFARIARPFSAGTVPPVSSAPPLTNETAP